MCNGSGGDGVSIGVRDCEPDYADVGGRNGRAGDCARAVCAVSEVGRAAAADPDATEYGCFERWRNAVTPAGWRFAYPAYRLRIL